MINAENTTLLQPDPQTILVSYHPEHSLGDAVSVQFDDREHGSHVVVFAPEVANHLSRLLATAVKSPRIGAIADQIRAEQRDKR
jgi:hypothetical protein